MTSNRSLLPSISDYDAIVFHLWDLTLKDLPDPSTRRKHQKYVFTTREAPTQTGGKNPTLQKLQKYFNYSITYRRDSTFYTPYGGFLRIKEHPMEGELFDSLIQEYGEKNHEMASKKNITDASIAQVVSNCHSHSGREGLLRSLQNMTKVHVYGLCGTMSCNKAVQIKELQSGHIGAGQSCYQTVEEKYKFYLSWENALCKDYITEKFFEIAKYDIIPVVLNIAAMELIAPKHS